MPTNRLSSDEERALIRWHIHGADKCPLGGHLRPICNQEAFLLHDLAQALIDKKRAQAMALANLAVSLDEGRCASNEFADRVRNDWEALKDRSVCPRMADLAMHWARKFEREARGE